MIDLDKARGAAELAAKDAKHSAEAAVAAKPWRSIAIIGGLIVLLAVAAAVA